VNQLAVTKPPERDRVAIGVLGVAGLAWFVLIAWAVSPEAPYLSHARLDHIRGIGAPLALAAGWTLMVTAMMLPTALPVISRASTRSRGAIGTLTPSWRAVGVAAGYLTVWIGFGVMAHLGDATLHEQVDGHPWLAHNSWIILAATIAIAGAYQLSNLARTCLEWCRAPDALVDHDGDPGVHSLAIGFRSGRACVGTCGVLMVLMFALGMGSIGWMIPMAALMAAEKNAPRGDRLRIPAGWFLLVCAATLAVVNLA
jgi:predicted metal-binding membrane protein